MHEISTNKPGIGLEMCEILRICEIKRVCMDGETNGRVQSIKCCLALFEFEAKFALTHLKHALV